MKRSIRLLCILLAVLMCVPTVAMASEQPGSRASYFFAKHSTYLERISSSKFEVWYEVLATGTMDELGVNTIEVQRSSDGTNWMTMRTYRKAEFPSFICENTVGHTGHVTYYGVSGYYYRALVTYYAKNSSGTGTYAMYSDTIQL